MNKTTGKSWLRTKLLSTIFLMVCLVTYNLLDFLKIVHFDNWTHLLDAAGSLVLVWLGIILLRQAISTKREQQTSR